MFNYMSIRFFCFTVIFTILLLLCFISCEKKLQNNSELSPNLIKALQTNNANTGKISENEIKNNTKYDFDPLELPVISTIEGSHLQVIFIALEAFKADGEISEDQKKIENYKVELRQNKEAFFIFFIAKLGKEEKPSFGGQTTLGKDTMFIVNKKDFTVKGRTFFK